MRRNIILTVIFFVAIVWFQSVKTKNKSDDYTQQAIALVKSVPEYGTNPAFFDTALIKHHERAFKAAYTSGRFKSTFSENIYRIALLNLFIQDAKAAGNTELLDALQRELQTIKR